MVIGKPTDAGTPKSALPTSSAGTRRVESGAAESGAAGVVAGVIPTDSVKLSDAGRALTAAGQAVDDFRADKVAAVKMALEQGTYRVHARIIADRMIAEAAELLETMAASR